MCDSEGLEIFIAGDRFKNKKFGISLSEMADKYRTMCSYKRQKYLQSNANSQS